MPGHIRNQPPWLVLTKALTDKDTLGVASPNAVSHLLRSGAYHNPNIGKICSLVDSNRVRSSYLHDLRVPELLCISPIRRVVSCNDSWWQLPEVILRRYLLGECSAFEPSVGHSAQIHGHLVVD